MTHIRNSLCAAACMTAAATAVSCRSVASSRSSDRSSDVSARAVSRAVRADSLCLQRLSGLSVVNPRVVLAVARDSATTAVLHVDGDLLTLGSSLSAVAVVKSETVDSLTAAAVEQCSVTARSEPRPALSFGLGCVVVFAAVAALIALSWRGTGSRR